jgi:hypothetical protein
VATKDSGAVSSVQRHWKTKTMEEGAGRNLLHRAFEIFTGWRK